MFERFSLPSDWSALEKRVHGNLLYYKSNYLLIAAAISLWTLVTRPNVLLFVTLAYALWAYVLLVRRAPLRFGRTTLKPTQKLGLLVILTVVLLFLTGSTLSLLLCLAIALLLTLLHAMLRPLNTAARVNEAGMNVRMRFEAGMGGGNDDSAAQIDSLTDLLQAVLGKPRVLSSPTMGNPKNDALDVEGRSASSNTTYQDFGSGMSSMGGDASSMPAGADTPFSAAGQRYEGVNRRRGAEVAPTMPGGAPLPSVPSSALPRPAHVKA